MPSQISVGVAVGDATALRGDFDDVSTLHPTTRVEVSTVNEFKDCIIAACGWLHVRRGDFTLVGPYDSEAAARASLAVAVDIAEGRAPIARIKRLDAVAHVIARVASGVNLDTGALRSCHSCKVAFAPS